MNNIRKQAGLVRIICAIVAFSLALAPISFAEAKVRGGSSSSNSAGSSHIQSQQQDSSSSYHLDGSNSDDGTRSDSEAKSEPEPTASSIDDPSAFTRITDEATGITVSARTSDTFNSETDKSCFSVEVLSDGDKVQTIKPCVSVMGENDKIGLIIPVDSRYTDLVPEVFICKDSEQKIAATILDDTIRVAVPNRTSVKIAYRAADASESNPNKVNTAIPDDDDEQGTASEDSEEEEVDWELVRRVAIVLIAALATIFIVAILRRKQAEQ